jgi:hypothetical protein
MPQLNAACLREPDAEGGHRSLEGEQVPHAIGFGAQVAPVHRIWPYR